jgi:hypothetical protein
VTYLYPQDFGAVGNSNGPNNGTDDTAAIDAWFAAMLAQKKPGRLAGMYRYKPTTPWNLTGQNWGWSVVGDRRHADGFYLDNGYQLRIEADQGIGVFYTMLSNLRIGGRFEGPILAIGRDDFSDAFNGFILEKMVVNNWLQNAANEGVRLNYFCAGQLENVTINCGGTGRPGTPTAPGWGTALKLRQAVFSDLKVDTGNAKVGIHVADGYNYSNHLRALDIEEVDTCLRISNAQSTKNFFASGTFVGRQIFECTAGGNNVIEKGCNRSPYSGGTQGAITGLVIR